MHIVSRLHMSYIYIYIYILMIILIYDISIIDNNILTYII